MRGQDLILNGFLLISLLGMGCVDPLATDSPTTATSSESPLVISTDCETHTSEVLANPENLEIDPEQARALFYVNSLRQWVGVPALQPDSSLTSAAIGHAHFISRHGASYPSSISLHDEIPGLEGYIAEKYWERYQSMGFEGLPVGELISSQPTARAAVRQAMESVYHRIPLIHPAASHLGYGSANSANSFMTVLEIGGFDHDSVVGPIAYPPDGATGVPTSWDGVETPQPPAPSTGYPSGPVFTLTFPEINPLLITEHLLVASNGKLIPHRFLTTDSDPFLGDLASMAIYAEDPLVPDEMYTIMIQGWVGEEPFTWTSSFKTAVEASCSPFSDDCGPGQACYIGGESTQCAWDGVTPEGQECLYQNDCAPGTICIEHVCRLLCDPENDQSAYSCTSRCPLDYSLLSVSEDFAACQPKSCAPGQGQCSDGLICILSAHSTCGAPGAQKEGASCTHSADCVQGLGCADVGAGYPTCSPLCDASTLAGTDSQLFPSDLPACATLCPKSGLLLADHPGLGICAP